MSCSKKGQFKLNKTLRKCIPLFSILYIIILALFVSNKATKAAHLTDGVWTQGGSPGTTTVTFTNATLADASSDIVLTFPSTASVDQDGTTATVNGTTNYIRTNKV